MSHLTWIDEPLTVLRRPILVLAFEGLFDIAGVATSALTWMTDGRAVRSIARIDPDPFYDFSDRRPTVWIDETGDRLLSWPENEAKVVSGAGAQPRSHRARRRRAPPPLEELRRVTRGTGDPYEVRDGRDRRRCR